MEDSRISTVDHEAVTHDFASSDRSEGLAAEINAYRPLPLSQNADVAAFELAQAAEQQANGKTARPNANEPQNADARQPIQIVPDNGNVVHLPPNTSIDDIHVEGRNLVLIQADGTRIVIINGALNVPTFLIGEVTLPQQAVVAALQQQGVNVAEGPDGSVHAGNSTNSGHQFTDSQAGNARTPLNLLGLLGPGGVIGNGNGGTNTQGNQAGNRGNGQVSQTQQTVAPLDATADTGSVKSGATISSDAAHGVLANDVTTVGGLQVVGVAAGSTETAQSGQVGSAIATSFGTLTLSADGSYSYHANPNESGTDTFTYTVRDANGTQSTTTLTFTVTDGRTSQPETADPTKLSEANLESGTSPSEEALTAQGSITLADPDNPHITGVTNSHGDAATVDAKSGDWQIQGSYGTLSIDADGKYSYTLTTAGVHAGGEQETFTYTVTDAHGNITTSTLSFTIADDAPIATADTGSLQSGVTVAADAV
ncbi:Ig-like domain-containing protein, partial [Rhizobium miluonense]